MALERSLDRLSGPGRDSKPVMHDDFGQDRDPIANLVDPFDLCGERVRGQANAARFQRAVEGAQHSPACRGDLIIDRQRQVDGIDSVVLLDLSVDAHIELGAVFETGPSVYSFDLPYG